MDEDACCRMEMDVWFLVVKLQLDCIQIEMQCETSFSGDKIFSSDSVGNSSLYISEM